MIRSFAHKRTAALSQRLKIKGVPDNVVKRAYEKLLQLDAITQLENLRVPPGNHLEALLGDRAGQHSFRWRGGDAYDVEFVDYH